MSQYTYQKKNLKLDNGKWWQGCGDEVSFTYESMGAGELSQIKNMES